LIKFNGRIALKTIGITINTVDKALLSIIKNNPKKLPINKTIKRPIKIPVINFNSFNFCSSFSMLFSIDRNLS